MQLTEELPPRSLSLRWRAPASEGKALSRLEPGLKRAGLRSESAAFGPYSALRPCMHRPFRKRDLYLLPIHQIQNQHLAPITNRTSCSRHRSARSTTGCSSPIHLQEPASTRPVRYSDLGAASTRATANLRTCSTAARTGGSGPTGGCRAARAPRGAAGRGRSTRRASRCWRPTRSRPVPSWARPATRLRTSSRAARSSSRRASPHTRSSARRGGRRSALACSICVFAVSVTGQDRSLLLLHVRERERERERSSLLNVWASGVRH